MHRSSTVLGGAVAAAALLAAAGAADATPFFFNASGTCSEACAANAVITPGAGELTVVLNDTQADPRSAGDLLSNFEITPSGTLGSASLSTQSGSLITVESNTGPYTITAGPPTHWEAGTSGSQIVLDAFGGPMAENLIIGPPDASGNYSSANSSITMSTHNPYINGTGTFVILDSAITADTTITAATFSFGTMLNENTLPGSVCTPGTPNCGSGPPLVPEPSALALIGSALVMFGFVWRRRSV
jgi:hypothetical protein